MADRDARPPQHARSGQPAENGGRQLARRGGWGLASEAVDAGSNFLMTVWIARNVGAREFGAFGVIYVTLQIAIFVGRSMSSMPMMIQFSTSSWRFSRRLTARASGASLGIGLLMALGLAVLGVVVHGPIRPVAFAGAIIAPALMLQDIACYIFILRQRPQLAFLNNLLWVLFQMPLFVGLTYGAHVHTAADYAIAWGIAAYAATAVSFIQLRSFPDLVALPGWLQRNRATIQDLTLDSMAQQLSQQSVTYAIGAGVNLSGVAAYRATQVPFGLSRTLAMGIQPLGVVEGARLYSRSPAALNRFIALWALASAVVTVVYGAILYYMPLHVGAIFFGKSWAPAHHVLLWIAVAAAAGNVALPSQAGLRALRATRAVVIMRIPIAITQLSSVIIGVLTGGLHGAVRGLAISSTCIAVITQVTFQRVLARSERDEDRAKQPVRKIMP